MHEGPHRISPLLDNHDLKAGMIVSNEPGYYEVDNFGIRIENLLVVESRPELGSFGGKSFLGFSRLTHIPFQTKMMQVELMTDKEIEWVNTYHSQVHACIYPLLKSDRARSWLTHSTLPLCR